MILTDNYLVPSSLTEALELAEQHRDSYKLIMGATDLIPNSRERRHGHIREKVVIDLGKISELRSVEKRHEYIEMGAGVTFGDFLTDSVLQQDVPILGQCARLVGDDQIRHEASIGGNIVNASPSADGTVCLMGLNAQVILEMLQNGVHKTRTLSLEDFVLGPGQTDIQPGEILTKVTCGSLGSRFGTAFRKVGHRRSLIIAVASVACVVKLSEDDSLEDVRLAVGAVSAVPVRITKCEQILKGQRPTTDLYQRAGELAHSYVASRTRQEYRREVLQNFVEEALEEAVERASSARSETEVEVQHD